MPQFELKSLEQLPPKEVKASEIPRVGSIDLGEDRVVLVKFYFSNERMIPPGVPQFTDWNQTEKDSQHAAASSVAANGVAGEEAAVVGRLRQGRVDTAKGMIEEVMTNARLIRVGLANADFVLTSVSWFNKDKPANRKGKPQKVVQMKYVHRSKIREGAKLPEMSRAALDGIRALSRITWQKCNVFDNPTPVITINLSGRHDQEALESLVVRHRALTIVPEDNSEE